PMTPANAVTPIMPRRSLRVLFVGGPMYDPLYTTLSAFERNTGWSVEVAGTLPHPTLNARIDEEFGGGHAAYDLISTHNKYAPAQRQWLSPLDEDLAQEELAAFDPRVLALARIEGVLYGVPRNLDVKLLYYRSDLMEDQTERARYRDATGGELGPPRTWEDLRAAAHHFGRGPSLYGFAFPGRDSGLFGHFFELLAAAGGRLLTEEFTPAFENAAGRWALELLTDLYREGAAPPETPQWHYDEVAACFRDGRAAMTTDWPGGFYTYIDPSLSRVSDVFDLAVYPTGKTGRRVYAGSHTFAIPVTVCDRAAALDLLRFLTSEDNQLLEARQGSLPTRPAVLARACSEAPARSLAARRWELLEKTVAAALFAPAHRRWPSIEEALWKSVQRALVGTLTCEEALAEAAREIRTVTGRSQETAHG
ncbi:MAG: extracellular solute-binding protein, partial [Armatimonadota bacterium]